MAVLYRRFKPWYFRIALCESVSRPSANSMHTFTQTPQHKGHLISSIERVHIPITGKTDSSLAANYGIPAHF